MELDERDTEIKTILQALCDPENQPHQYMGDWGQAYDDMFIVSKKEDDHEQHR